MSSRAAYRKLVGLLRSETQREVLHYLIASEKSLTSNEIAKGLNLSVSAVNMALFRLKKKGLIKQASRGVYSYKVGPLLTSLLGLFFKIERERK